MRKFIENKIISTRLGYKFIQPIGGRLGFIWTIIDGEARYVRSKR